MGCKPVVANDGTEDQKPKQPLLQEQAPSSSSKDHVVKKLQDAQHAGGEDISSSTAAQRTAQSLTGEWPFYMPFYVSI